jgi:CheY-like chemotaxis protein
VAEVVQPSSQQSAKLGKLEEVVLVVEDDPMMRRLSTETLVELGYTVLESDGAASALSILDQRPDIKLLFTDVVMPDVNGKKLADEAVRRRPDLKVLFTTGYTQNAVVHGGVLDAGVNLLSKPFALDQLAAKVRMVLDA